jgi:AcrR family transcriptional regulator
MNPRSARESDVPPLRERIRQATSAAILAAAEEVFAAQGLQKARMNDIAARAGVAVGTLYNHFKDRDDLLAGLLEVRRQEMLDMVDTASDAPGLDFRARLHHVFTSFFAYIDAHQPFYKLLHQVAEQQGPPTEMVKDLYARMERLVKRGIKEKALRPSGADVYPALLMGCVRTPLLRSKVSGHMVKPDVDELVRFFLEGAGT